MGAVRPGDSPDMPISAALDAQGARSTISFPAGPDLPLADDHRQELARAWLRGLTNLAMRIIRLSPRSRG